MKKITVGYWHSKLEGLKYKHLEEFEYSLRKRNDIIKDVLSKDYSIILRPLSDGTLMIWIDNGRFGQR